MVVAIVAGMVVAIVAGMIVAIVTDMVIIGPDIYLTSSEALQSMLSGRQWMLMWRDKAKRSIGHYS